VVGSGSRLRVIVSSAGRRMRSSAGYWSLVIVYDTYTLGELLTCCDFFSMLIERAR